MFYIFSLLYHIFLLISYRIKIYIQYHYVYYIYTLCLYLRHLHLIYLHLIYLHLIYSHLIYSHLIYSHLIYSHLIYLPFKFTSIIFQKIRRCAPHIETCPPPSHPHSRLNLPHPIPSHTYNGLKTISLPTTPSGRSPPSAQPSVSNTAAYRHKSTKLPPSTTKHSKKKPEGCAEGPRLCGPFAVFLFSQKNTASVRQPERNTVFFKSIFLHFVT